MADEPNTPPDNAETDTGSGQLSMAAATKAVEALLSPPPVVQPPKVVARTTPPADELDDDAAPTVDEPDDDDLLDDEADDAAAKAPASDVDADEEPDDDEEITATIKRGKTLTLKRGELKDGLRRADYTRKTAAAAEVVRKAEAEMTALQEQRTRLSAILEAQAKAEEDAVPPEPEDSERELDPGNWAAKREMRRAALERVQGLRAYRGQLQQQVTDDATKSLQAKLKIEHEKLIEKEPKWSDPKKFERDTTIIRRGIAKHYGIPEAAVAATSSHEAVLVMRDALRYRQMIAKRDEIKPTVEVGIPVLRPGGKQPKVDAAATARKDALSKLRKTGSVDAGAEALIALGLLGPRPKR